MGANLKASRQNCNSYFANTGGLRPSRKSRTGTAIWGSVVKNIVGQKRAKLTIELCDLGVALKRSPGAVECHKQRWPGVDQ